MGGEGLMAKITMTLTGMEGLQRALTVAPDLVQRGAADAVAKTAFAIAQRARALVPVRTGTLKAAITSASTKTSGRVGVDARAGHGSAKPAVYWRYVEFGARKIPARPFFRPAAEAETNGYLERLRRVGSALERDLSTSSVS
jgi:HK97 gp10 family phage protein